MQSKLRPNCDINCKNLFQIQPYRTGQYKPTILNYAYFIHLNYLDRYPLGSYQIFKIMAIFSFLISKSAVYFYLSSCLSGNDYQKLNHVLNNIM